PERFAEIARPFLAAVVAVADEDGTGATPAAATRVLRVLGTPPPLAAHVAAALAGPDGHISEDATLKAFAAYCGVDPNA
ncbi:calcium-binding protein, partial [Streptomyces katrae]